jgi:hypothetical protein
MLFEATWNVSGKGAKAVMHASIMVCPRRRVNIRIFPEKASGAIILDHLQTLC